MYLSLILAQRYISIAFFALVQIEPVVVKGFTVTKFARDINLDDYYCKNDIVTTERAVSLMACLQFCRSNANDTADSLLYSESTAVCQCHRSSNTSDLDCMLQKDSGYRFFSQVRLPVTTSASTTVGNQLTTASPLTQAPTTVGNQLATVVPLTQASTSVGVPFLTLLGIPMTQKATTNGITTVPLTQASTSVGVPFLTLLGIPMTQKATTNGITTVPLTQASTSVGVPFLTLLGIPMTQKATTYGITTVTSATQTTNYIGTTNMPADWDFRLVNGSASSGRLEVSHNGSWGAVYGFSFSVEDATVMCRDIFDLANFGYPIYGDHFGVPDTSIGLTKDYYTENNLICYVNRTCNEESWKSENETDFKEFGTVGLDCTDSQIDVQLADGVNSSSGRLEVRLLNTWGTVCGDNSWQDGPMFCRYFGLNYTSYELAGTEQTSGPIWIHGNLYACSNGNESSPMDCQWSPYTKSYFSQNCNHTVDVILYCQ